MPYNDDNFDDYYNLWNEDDDYYDDLYEDYEYKRKWEKIKRNDLEDD